jgi:membrane fusion protein, multidrug efflux system
MLVKFYRIALFLPLAIMLASCQRENANQKSAPPPPKVTVAQPVRYSFTPMGDYTGYLDAYQRVEIRPQVKGVLKSVHFNEGTEIEKNTLLYEIDRTEYETAKRGAEAARQRAKADSKRAEAELAKAIADKKRADTLIQSNAISAEEYQQFMSTEQTAQATVLQAIAGMQQAQAAYDKAVEDLGYTMIRAPFSGRISRTLVTPGNLVGYGGEPTQLTVMVMNDPIYVFFDVPEPEAIAYERLTKSKGLPTWSEGKIPIQLEVDTESGYPHEGVINFREPRYDSASGTVRLRAILSNSDRKLSSGMFARVRFPIGVQETRLLVPADAVLSDQRGRYVFVVKPDNMVEARTVQTGQRIDTFLAITDGLTEQDTVVVVGMQKAKPKAPVTPETITLTPPPPEEKIEPKPIPRPPLEIPPTELFKDNPDPLK